MHARAVARLTGSYAPRVDGYHVDSLAIITLTCVDCKCEYSGPYRKHRQRCPDCKAEWIKKCHRESYQRLTLERGPVVRDTSKRVVTTPRCDQGCEHWQWCVDHVLEGAPLPCAPETGIADCRQELRVDSLSRRSSYVLA
jgi:hypothetical protein